MLVQLYAEETCCPLPLADVSSVAEPDWSQSSTHTDTCPMQLSLMEHISLVFLLLLLLLFLLAAGCAGLLLGEADIPSAWPALAVWLLSFQLEQYLGETVTLAQQP